MGKLAFGAFISTAVLLTFNNRSVWSMFNSSELGKSDVPGDIEYIEQQLREYRARVEKFEEEHWLDNINKKDNPQVHFSAFRSVTRKYKKGMPIYFENVKSNVGGGFMSDKATFRAPITGYYLFHLSIYTETIHYIFVDLIRKSTGWTYFRIRAECHGQFNEYSKGGVVVWLREGYEVTTVIQTLTMNISNTEETWPVEPGYLTKFDGTLIRPLEFVIG